MDASAETAWRGEMSDAVFVSVMIVLIMLMIFVIGV